MIGVNRRALYTWEYLLVTLPFSILFLLSGNWGAFLIQSLGIMGLALLPNLEVSKQSFGTKMDFRLFHKEAFEARSYFRRFFIPIGLLYIVGLITIKYTGIPIGIIILTALFFSSFFDEVENKDLFEAIHFRRGILTEKAIRYIGLFLLLTSPFIILFLVLHVEYWYILLAALFVGVKVILFNLLYKYAHFTPYRRRVYNSIANSMFFLAVLIPFFYPATLLFLVYYWRKARKNIKVYYA
jgi:hypothetical protein